MTREIRLSELETLTTTRVLCERLINYQDGSCRLDFDYKEAEEQCMYALDDILVEMGLNDIFWARLRGKRLFLFYLPQKRIATEVGIVTDKAPSGRRCRFRMQFVGYKGKILPNTISGLIQLLERTSYRSERNTNENNRNDSRKRWKSDGRHPSGASRYYRQNHRWSRNHQSIRQTV